MAPGHNIIVGIAGGTGSGKTTLARSIRSRLKPYQSVLIHQDSYYRDQAGVPLKVREATDYDHPDAFDTPLLVEHLQALKRGEPIDQPIYDFSIHTRNGSTRVNPAPIIILEGILILAEPDVRAVLDVPLFVDTPDDIRFMRRLRRDLGDRGRTLDSVYRQYTRTVRPAHLEFVEPSKRYARLIIPEGGLNEMATDVVASYIQRHLDSRPG